MPAGSAPHVHRLFAAALLAAGLATACKQTHVVFEPVSDGGAGDTGGAGGTGGPGGAGGAGVTTVSTAYNHTCAIARGALYCWGANADGRLGVDDMDPRRTPARVGDGTDWVDIQAGWSSSLGLKRDGTLWSFGANDKGQLGQGDFMARQAPAQIGKRTGWKSIAIRFEHACAVRDDWTLWCWGEGLEGQLGQGEAARDGNDRPEPTQVMMIDEVAMVDTGQGHTCAILRNGTLWCWGRNTYSILSQGAGTPERIKLPVQVGLDADWKAIRTGQSATCGLRGGRVYCWGQVLDNSQPGSANNSEVPVPVPTMIRGVNGATGLTFNTFGGCSFDAQGGGACWGRNAEGQLGLGEESAWEDVVALPLMGWASLSAGRFSTCGVRNGGVWCTGDNSAGQLGLGDVSRVARFMEVDLEP